MPTPEQQRLYSQLSGQLQAIGIRYRKELPAGATSLLLKNNGGKIRVEVYEGSKVIGLVPNESTSAGFRTALETNFANAVSPDPDGVVALL
jgi:hypothetical protein